MDKWYENLVRNPERAAAELFAFVGRDLRATTHAVLQDSQSRCGKRTCTVFKDPSVADRWRLELPEAIQEAIRVELAGTLPAWFPS